MPGFCCGRALLILNGHCGIVFFCPDKENVSLKGCPVCPLEVNIYVCSGVCSDITARRSEQKNSLLIKQIIGARRAQPV
jgi:hypothetical protein